VGVSHGHAGDEPVGDLATGSAHMGRFDTPTPEPGERPVKSRGRPSAAAGTKREGDESYVVSYGATVERLDLGHQGLAVEGPIQFVEQAAKPVEPEDLALVFVARCRFMEQRTAAAEAEGEGAP
jgi:hypothetical protein